MGSTQAISSKGSSQSLQDDGGREEEIRDEDDLLEQDSPLMINVKA